jgi:hypothetical protein
MNGTTARTTDRVAQSPPGARRNRPAGALVAARRAEVAGLVGRLAAESGRIPTVPEVSIAAKARLPHVGDTALRNDLKVLEKSGAIPRLPREAPKPGATWRDRIEAERRQSAFVINNHRPRSTSRLPPGVPSGYAERAARRHQRWSPEDEKVYRHWRSGIDPVTAGLLFLDVPGGLLAPSRGAETGWESEEDEL